MHPRHEPPIERHSPESPAPTAPRRHPWRRLLWTVLVLGAVLAIIQRARVHRDRNTYESALAAIRAAGEPLTPADFAVRYPPPPPERDFRRLLRSCLPEGSPAWADPELVERPPIDELRNLTNRARLEPGLLQTLATVVQSNAPPVELLLQTDLSRYGFLLVWTNGFFGANNEVSGDRIFTRIDLAHALAVQAVYEAESGQPSRALTALIRGLQVARLPSPMGLISGVGLVACESITLSVLQRVLNTCTPDEDSLRALQEGLPRQTDVLRDALIAERAFQIFCWNLPAEAFSQIGVQSPLFRASLRVATVLRGYRGRVEMLQRWNQRVAATQLPLAQQLPAIRELQSDVTRMISSQAGLPDWLHLAAIDPWLTGLLEPQTSAFCEENAVVTATLAVARTAVAIERWRLRHPGRLPDSLADLVPDLLTEIPPDPFDEQPLRYRRLPRGYVVYSVGLDFQDNGGVESRRGDTPGTDITLVIER